MTTWLRIAILAGLVVLGAAAGWAARGWRADAAMEKVRAEHAAELQAASDQARQQMAATIQASQRLATLAQGVLDDLHQTNAQIARDRAALGADRERLLDAWRASAAQCRAAPGGAADAGAAEPAELVRADLFARARDRAAELAGAVDEQHAYGRACAVRFRQLAEQMTDLRNRLADAPG